MKIEYFARLLIEGEKGYVTDIDRIIHLFISSE